MRITRLFAAIPLVAVPLMAAGEFWVFDVNGNWERAGDQKPLKLGVELNVGDRFTLAKDQTGHQPKEELYLRLGDTQTGVLYPKVTCHVGDCPPLLLVPQRKTVPAQKQAPPGVSSLLHTVLAFEDRNSKQVQDALSNRYGSRITKAATHPDQVIALNGGKPELCGTLGLTPGVPYRLEAFDASSGWKSSNTALSCPGSLGIAISQGLYRLTADEPEIYFLVSAEPGLTEIRDNFEKLKTETAAIIERAVPKGSQGAQRDMLRGYLTYAAARMNSEKAAAR